MPRRHHRLVDKRGRGTRTGPTLAAGPVLVFQMCLAQLNTASPTTLCARVALSANRNTHRPKRGHIRRARHRASCAAAPPTSTSVTRVQSGGLPSSVEHVDTIGSSFPFRQRRSLPSPISTQYLPLSHRREPHLNCTFANMLVAAGTCAQFSRHPPGIDRQPLHRTTVPTIRTPDHLAESVDQRRRAHGRTPARKPIS